MINQEILDTLENLAPLEEEFLNLGGNPLMEELLGAVTGERYKELSPTESEERGMKDIRILKIALEISKIEKKLLALGNQNYIYLGMHQVLYRAIKKEDYKKAALITEALNNFQF